MKLRSTLAVVHAFRYVRSKEKGWEGSKPEVDLEDALCVKAGAERTSGAKQPKAKWPQSFTPKTRDVSNALKRARWDERESGGQKRGGSGRGS